MRAAQILKRKIESRELTLGVMSTFHFWPGLVEIAMQAGLDYLIIDLEHLTHNHEAVADACAVGRLKDFPVLVRPPDPVPTALRLALDLGPCGLLLPCVQGPDTMQVVQDAVLMPPRGRRRPGGPGNRWVANYHYETWRREVEDDLIILPQIESREGLAQVEAIARHPLTTAMAVGPYDLSASLGVCWQPDSQPLLDALARIRSAAQAAGKNLWMIGDAAALKTRGYTFLCMAETTMLLEGTLRSMAASLRAPGTGRSSDSPPRSRPQRPAEGHAGQRPAPQPSDTPWPHGLPVRGPESKPEGRPVRVFANRSG